MNTTNTRTIAYDFRFRDNVWRDINNPERYTLDLLFHRIGVRVPEDYVTYCIIDNDRVSIKYRRVWGIIKVYVTYF